MFQRGEIVLERSLSSRREVIDAKPMTVVSDTDERLLLWIPLDTPTIQAVLFEDPGEGPRRWLDGTWHIVPSVWRWSELLVVVEPGAARATWLRWDRDGRFLGWYVNLQEPLVRTELGFDVRDQDLDILVEPDGSWRWKDEDELEIAVQLGRITPDAARAARKEGLRAIADLEAGRAPFCDPWPAWRPDPDLPIPRFPDDPRWRACLPIDPPMGA